MDHKSELLRGKRIDPPAIRPNISLVDLIDQTFNAYNAARFREACHLFSRCMLEDDVTVGVSLSGALTPAGLGIAAIIPLMRAGFVDWIVSTGANLYHDTHFGIGLEMKQGSSNVDDRLCASRVSSASTTSSSNTTFSSNRCLRQGGDQLPGIPEIDEHSEFHYLLGQYVRERERLIGLSGKSLLGVASELEVPIYTSSPGTVRSA